MSTIQLTGEESKCELTPVHKPLSEVRNIALKAVGPVGCCSTVALIGCGPDRQCSATSAEGVEYGA